MKTIKDASPLVQEALADLGGALDRLSEARAAARVAALTVIAAGGTWRMIGTVAGTSAQAAWERWRPKEPTEKVMPSGVSKPLLPLDSD
jgi:hypothetical protein